MNKKLKKFILYLPLLLSFLLIIYSSNYIFLWVIDHSKTNKLKNDLKEISNVRDINFNNYALINPPKDKNDDYYQYIDEKFLEVDFYDLLKQNNDTVGWVAVNGTEVNYPIVKSKNNNFYLNHSFDKSENKAGWIFVDYRNDLDDLSFNTILYGHGRSDYTMFGSLRKTLKEEWFNEKRNHVIKLTTPKEYTIWQIISVYEIEKESYYISTYFKNNKTYQKFLDTILSRSKFNFNTSLNTNDKILTLSTCKDTIGNRIVVHSKLIKKGTF